MASREARLHKACGLIISVMTNFFTQWLVCFKDAAALGSHPNLAAFLGRGKASSAVSGVSGDVCRRDDISLPSPCSANLVLAPLPPVRAAISIPSEVMPAGKTVHARSLTADNK